MARVVGVDLGAYSVKVAVVTPSFRSASVSEFIERVVPDGDESHLVRAARVAGAIVREFSLGQDIHYVAVPGDQTFTHVLELPYKSLRKADLDKAVGAELESILPIDLEDMVYAFDQLPKVESAPTSDPEFVAAEQTHGLVADPVEGMRVLACAMHRERAKAILDALEDEGVSPRGLIAAPESYNRVIGRVARLDNEQPVAVINLGHSRTDVCILHRGRTIYARTVARGSGNLTQAIASVWNLPFAQAESAKHQDGFIGSSAQPPPTEAWKRIHDALLPEMKALARDLRQTLATCRARVGVTATSAILVGGGARLRGISEFLSEQLTMNVTLLNPEDHDAILGGRHASGADAACVSVGVALEGATGRPVFDLRQGDLAVKADLSALRAKAVPLAMAGLAILGFMTIAGFAKMKSLKSAEKILVERLALETAELFGKTLSAEEALAKVGPTQESASILPKQSAVKLLFEISDALPPNGEVDVDVTDISIKGGKITIDMLARPTDKLKASNALSEIEKKLKAITCFESVNRGDSTTLDDDAKKATITVAIRKECA